VSVTPSETSTAVNVAVPGDNDLTVNVTIPNALERPEGAEIESAPPRSEDSDTVFPGIGFRRASLRITVTIEGVTPLAMTEGGFATTVELDVETGPTMNWTDAVLRNISESVVSIGVSVETPATVDLTVKIAVPETEEVTDAGVIVSRAPRLEAMTIVFPGTARLESSRTVTVMVELRTPFATSEYGDTLIVELTALAGPGRNVTEADPVV
jgi:hypothetical protein